MSNPYEVLGVSRDTSDDEVRDAYRERVKEVHPDHGGTKEEFIEVRDAYLAIINDEVESFGEDKKSQSPNGNGTNRWRQRSSRGSWEGQSRRRRRSGVAANVEYLDYMVVLQKGWSLDDDNLFHKARKASLTEEQHGHFKVNEEETVLSAAERNGHDWPYSCRGGACANCAIKVIYGEVRTPGHAILSDALLNRDYRLSCIGEPLTSAVRIVFNIKDRDELEDMLLPSR